MNESPSLRDASVQEIQLELLRRRCWNALDGERAHASLLKHRDLWLAVLLDWPGVANYAEPSSLLMSGLIKLRDLPDNFWNAGHALHPHHHPSAGRGASPDRRRRELGGRGRRLSEPERDRSGTRDGPSRQRPAFDLVGLTPVQYR